MAQQNPHIIRFVDRLGHYFEMQGASRSAGQILAWLLISEEPQSLDDLVAELHISKGSASLGTRVWERTGLIERVNVRGDRKTYYRLHPQVGERFAQAALVKFRELVDMLDEALEHLGDDRPVARANVDTFAAVYRHLLDKVPKLLGEWEKERKKG